MSDERLPDLFLEAQELEEDERRALLQRVASEDPGLAAELERLLAAPASAASPIDGSALTAVGFAGGAPAPIAAPERVGPFRIVRELGRGGMGRVFLAEQETPDYRRTVALKLIDRTELDAEAVRRFRDEVRILAALDHPNIVRFLHGGRSPEGTWFLALEYVEGEDLISHANERDLTVEQRVRLLLPVADAVAFAHARGIVHRDLKPTNVLVGRDGRPRLRDFGISKLLDPASPSNLTTQAGPRLFTPAYASPEQVAGGSATPASDVYSLGVVLYELLVGRRPTPGAELESPSAARRRLRSTARRSGGGDSGATTAPRGRVGRRLDAVCLRALAPEPADRHPSMAEFAAELRRAVAGAGGAADPAAAPDRGARRGVWLAAGVAAAALVGLGLYAWLRPAAPPASVAAAPARGEATPFPFDPVNPPPIEETEKRFAEAPDDVEAGAALALGLARARRWDEAKIVVGRLRQIPKRELDPLVDYVEGRIASLSGEHQRALVFYTRARDTALRDGRADLIGTIRGARGSILALQGQRDAGIAELELARAESERAGDLKALYRTMNELAIGYFQRGDMDLGEQMFEDQIAVGRLAGLTPILPLSNLAEVRIFRGRPDLAEPLARETLVLREKFPQASRKGDELTRLGLVLRDLGRSAEAEPLFDEAVALLRASTHALGRSAALFARAEADLESGRLDRIDGLIAELDAAAQEGLHRRPLAFAQMLRGRLAATRGEPLAARTALDDARRLFLLDGDEMVAKYATMHRGEAEALAGEPATARAVLDEGLGPFRPETATVPTYHAETLRARIAAEDGRTAEAAERLAALAGALESSPNVRLRIAFLEARSAVAAAEGRTEPAVADLQSALALARSADRRPDELRLRIELALLLDGARRQSALVAAEREAESLGLAALAAKARTLRRETLGAGRT